MSRRGQHVTKDDKKKVLLLVGSYGSRMQCLGVSRSATGELLWWFYFSEMNDMSDDGMNNNII